MSIPGQPLLEVAVLFEKKMYIFFKKIMPEIHALIFNQHCDILSLKCRFLWNNYAKFQHLASYVGKARDSKILSFLYFVIYSIAKIKYIFQRMPH